MQHIGITILLQRIEGLLASSFAVREMIQESILEATGVLIEKENILVQNSIVRVRTSPLYRQEIFFKKDMIIDFFNKKQTKTKITNIQ